MGRSKEIFNEIRDEQIKEIDEALFELEFQFGKEKQKYLETQSILLKTKINIIQK